MQEIIVPSLNLDIHDMEPRMSFPFSDSSSVSKILIPMQNVVLNITYLPLLCQETSLVRIRLIITIKSRNKNIILP